MDATARLTVALQILTRHQGDINAKHLGGSDIAIVREIITGVRDQLCVALGADGKDLLNATSENDEHAEAVQ
jgi:hypothetical protein